jgi:hypothetical protein
MADTILSVLVALRAVEAMERLDRSSGGGGYWLTKECVDDVNRVYHTNYHWPECVKFRENVDNIAMLYLAYQGLQYFRQTGHIPGYGEFARACGDRMKRPAKAIRKRRVREGAKTEGGK